MKRLLILLTMISALFRPLPITTGDYRVFLVPGQSNAQGAIAVPPTQKTSERVIKFTYDGWVTAREPTNILYSQPDSTWGYSPATAFALDMLRVFPKWKIAIINCAKGSTSIAEWQKGGVLYNTCLRIAKSQRAGTIAGVLFIQGESDTATPEAARAWEGQFKQFVEDLRTDLGNRNLPIILPLLGTIPPYNPHLGWYDLRKIQIDIPQKVRNVSTVETIDLIKPDGYHYDFASVKILAQRMANKIRKYYGK